jgi:PAS domain S-box-containing protein
VTQQRPENTDECILILAPTGRDAELTASFLKDVGAGVVACRAIDDLTARARHGCGAIILAEEAMNPTSVQALGQILYQQPSWSEIPLIIVTSGGDLTLETLRQLELFRRGGNVTVLERPFRPATLVHAVEVAIRSRRRQYQVRDLLTERTAAAERFRFMAESMPQKTFTAQPSGEVDYFNRQWSEFTGLTPENLKDSGWLPFVHPDDLASTRESWQRSLRTGDPFQIEHRFRREDGCYRWHLTRAQALRDGLGRAQMWIGTNADIDEQKRAAEHLEKIVDERTDSLRETNKQLEAFCYTISHDLRAPLRAQQGFATALLEEYGDLLGETGRDYANRINQAATRLDNLVNDLLAYSRISRTEIVLAEIDLRRPVSQVYEEMTFEIGQAHAQVDLVPCPQRVVAHEVTLRVAISNLLSNALKFTKPNVPPAIRIWAEERGAWIRLWLQDNGIGIAPEHHEQIFGVFQRLHKAGQYPGTGVGLAIVAKAIERMGGRAGVESQAGAGSRFWIELKNAA